MFVHFLWCFFKLYSMKLAVWLFFNLYDLSGNRLGIWSVEGQFAGDEPPAEMSDCGRQAASYQ
ncbi:hypothetical protein A7K99_06080 [Tatumella citrea]|uniref:Uncharacterized protein n=1 Tax=Tatumella citrea TaxID=53336 RepID=A0A1Y0L6T8_TATCI|nr:hypothetical protein A7K98_06080 [Tatumella citrea]ARU97427.1 hypothetical protein A7K99_06080 [Tatumella citrea]